MERGKKCFLSGNFKYRTGRQSRVQETEVITTGESRKGPEGEAYDIFVQPLPAPNKVRMYLVPQTKRNDKNDKIYSEDTGFVLIETIPEHVLNAQINREAASKLGRILDEED